MLYGDLANTVAQSQPGLCSACKKYKADYHLIGWDGKPIQDICGSCSSGKLRSTLVPIERK